MRNVPEYRRETALPNRCVFTLQDCGLRRTGQERKTRMPHLVLRNPVAPHAPPYPHRSPSPNYPDDPRPLLQARPAIHHNTTMTPSQYPVSPNSNATTSRKLHPA